MKHADESSLVLLPFMHYIQYTITVEVLVRELQLHRLHMLCLLLLWIAALFRSLSLFHYGHGKNVNLWLNPMLPTFGNPLLV